MFKKIKGSTGIDQTTAIYFMVIIVVGISAFGLGRLSAEDAISRGDEGIVIKDTQESLESVPRSQLSARKASAIKTESQAGGNYVASKNGKLYYPRGCKGANRIKPENEVWFTSSSDAEKLGYAPSSSCK
jgi:hypothetical protein